MTSSVNYYRIASHCCSSNTCDVGGSLCSRRADANGVGFVSNTRVANIDITIACGEVGTGASAQRNIVAAGCVGTQRKSAHGCVLAAGCIVTKRTSAGGCVGAAGCVAHKRPSTSSCIEKG